MTRRANSNAETLRRGGQLDRGRDIQGCCAPVLHLCDRLVALCVSASLRLIHQRFLQSGHLLLIGLRGSFIGRSALLERLNQPLRQLLANLFNRWRGGSEQFLDARHWPSYETARDDQVEVTQVGGDVQRDAVKRDASSDAHADGADFSLCP